MALKNLGSLFGGKIVSINYNFQIGSEPSVCTITILNENQIYNEPVFGSTVSIPPFGIKMDVLEWTIHKDEYRYLQVELVESIHQKLDKELVLIFGVHTDLQGKLNNDKYFIYDQVYIGKEYWKTTPWKDITFPSYENSSGSNNSTGINVIGFARATVNQNVPTALDTKDFKEDSRWIKFDKGVYNPSISNGDINLLKQERADNVSVEFGYTLSQLKDLLLSKGIAFLDGSDSHLNDSVIMFSEIGSLRNVLSGCLSQIGKSFYVDPITQSIKIISNSDILLINSQLETKYNSFSEECATQLSFSKSIKGVAAPHIIIKGNFASNPQSGNGFESGDPPTSYMRVNKLETPSLYKHLTKKDQIFFNHFMPLLTENDSEEMVKLYIFGIASKYGDTNFSGDLYGKDDWNIDKDTKWDFQNKTEEKVKDFWDALPLHFNSYLSKSSTTKANIFYGKEEGIPLTDFGVFFEKVRNYLEFWSGIYFSDAIPKRVALRRDISSEIARSGQRVEWGWYPEKDFLADHEAFNRLRGLLVDSGHGDNFTIGKAAKAAGSRVGGIADENWILVCFQKPTFKYKKPFIDMRRDILKNLFHTNSIEPEGEFLFRTRDADKIIEDVKNDVRRAMDVTEDRRGVSYLSIPFIRKKGSEEGSSNEGSENVDYGSIHSIKTYPSRTRFFDSRDIIVYEGGYSEIENMKKNFGYLNPAQPSPIISTTVQYDRAPIRSDFYMENGLSSLSISVSSAGIKTTINYSSRKFLEVRDSIIKQGLGGAGGSRTSFSNPPSYGYSG